MAGFTIQIQLDQSTTAALSSIAASLKGQQKTLVAIETAMEAIAKALEPPPPPVPVRIRLALPLMTKKDTGQIMANFEIPNDIIATIPILVDDAAGEPVPAPAGDVFTAVSSSPSLGVAINGSSLVLTPLVQASPGISVTVSDSAGLASFTQIVDIVQDTTPKAITLDLAHVTGAPQPVPTATGP